VTEALKALVEQHGAAGVTEAIKVRAARRSARGASLMQVPKGWAVRRRSDHDAQTGSEREPLAPFS